MKVPYLIILLTVFIIFITCTNPTNTGDEIGKPIIAWTGNADEWDSGDIFIWDGDNTAQMTEDKSNTLPQLSGNNVVWSSMDGNDYEIFFWNGDITKQITDNNFNDITPQISGNNVVWVRDNKIFLWYGDTTIEISYTGFYTPQISGATIV